MTLADRLARARSDAAGTTTPAVAGAPVAVPPPASPPGEFVPIGRAAHRAAAAPVIPVQGAATAAAASSPAGPPAAARRAARPSTPSATGSSTAPPDALGRLKDRTSKALYERIGARMTDSALSEDQLAALVRAQLGEVVDAQDAPLTGDERERLLTELGDDVLGNGPLQRLLDDDSITEIMVNGSDRIYVEKGGRLQRTDVCFSSEEQLRRVIERIVSRVGRRIDESSPLVDARLPDGSRVNAVIPPLAVSGSTLTIRKFSKDPFKTKDLISFGTLTPGMAELLDACVSSRLNIIVSGGTGTGKTTLLNVLSSFIPDDERIVTIEDSVELQLQQDHVVRLESRPPNVEGRGEVTIRDLVRNALRMRPDRIVVGECRGGESLDMLQAMNTGHDGSLSTVHANSPRDAIARLETLVLMAGMDLPLRAIREQIASAVDVVVQLTRLRDGTRRVTHVTEVQGMEGDVVTLQDAFVFDYSAGVDANGRFLGTPVPTGVRPRFADKFRDMGITVSPLVFGGELRELPEVSGVLLTGLLALYSAAGILVWFVVAPATGRVPLDRRTLPGQATESTLTGATARVSTLLDGVVRRRGRSAQMKDSLIAAGLTVSPGQYLVLVLGATLGVAAAGVVLSGLPLGLVLALVALLVGWRTLPFLAGRRHAKFGSQLDGALQLIASSLRAGHSLMRALDAVAREAESPMAEEFSRVVNETKVGRDVGRTIDEAATRNASVDLHWVAQAIAIHREVGGNLADVLDGVGATIRERNQIRRQVQALAAEGKLSAFVLMALPVGIFGFLLMTNPSYMGQLLQSALGIGMLVVAVLLLGVGGFWLSRVVKIKF